MKKTLFIPNNEINLTVISNIIFNNFLGKSNSSIASIGSLNSSRQLGYAKIGIFSNLTNGNLYIEDHTVHITDGIWSHNLGLVFNSQGIPAWQLNIGRRLDLVSTATAEIILIEDDGAKIRFDVSNNCIAETPNGNYKLTKNADSTFTVFHYDSGRYSQFNNNGLEISRTNHAGIGIKFEYSNDSILQKLHLPSGRIIKFNYYINNIFVSLHDTSGDFQERLFEYEFDEQKFLTKTTIAINSIQNYIINYLYKEDHTLYSISQTDTTKVNFEYSGLAGKAAISKITNGENHCLLFTYQDQQRIWQLGKDKKNQHIALLDSKGHIQSLDKPYITKEVSGNDTLKFKKTEYSYSRGDRLSHIMYSGGTSKSFNYDNQTGLLSSTLTNTNIITKNFYDPNTGLITAKQCNATVEGEETTLTQFFVYDEQHNLRYHISAQGKVTRYDWDPIQSLLLSIREQTNTSFLTEGYNPLSLPTLVELKQWWASSEQDITKATLTEYAYNESGQLIRKSQYATVDSNGKGLVTDATQATTYTDITPTGEWLTKVTRQSKSKFSTHIRKLDGLRRKIYHSDGLNRTTTNTFIDSQNIVITERPTGLKETVQKDKAGLTTRVRKSGDNLTYEDSFVRNSFTGFIEQTITPAGIWLTEYEPSGHLSKTIDPEKNVTVFYFDDRDYLQTIKRQHAEISEYSDREETTLRDANERPKFIIDADGYITELLHDDSNHLIGKIKYEMPLPPSTPRAISADDKLMGVTQSPNDRVWTYYLNADGQRIGKQDDAGFVTSYQRNLAGAITRQLDYKNAQARNSSWNNLQQNAQQGNSFSTDFILDLQGNKETIIDPEKFTTHYSWLGNGKWHTKTRGNHCETQEFDLENNLILFDEEPFGRQTFYQIDAHNKVKDIQIIDTKSGKIAFHTTTTRNAFSEVTSTTGPRKNESVQYVFEEKTGFKAQKIDSLGYRHVIFQNRLKQTLLEINPDGVVTIYSYNEFGDKISKRIVMTPLSQDDRKKFIGGLLTDQTLETLDTCLKINDLEDKVRLTKTNNRGLIVETIDEERYSTTEVFNAWHEKIKISEDIDHDGAKRVAEIYYAVNPGLKHGRTITYIMNPNGLRIETVKTLNCHNHLQHIKNSNGSEESFEIDSYGNITAHTDHTLNITEFWEYDAYQRETSYTNLKGNTVTTFYQDNSRSRTISSSLKKHHTVKKDIFGHDSFFTNPDNKLRQVLLNSSGDIEKVIDEMGSSTDHDYNSRGDLIKITFPNQLIHKLELKPGGNVERQHEVSEEELYTTDFISDADGFTTKITNANNQDEIIKHDRRSLPINRSIPLENDTHQELTKFNGLKQPIQHIKKDDQQTFITKITRDDLGRIVSQTFDPATPNNPNALHLTTSYQLDTEGHAIKTINPNGKASFNLYNQRNQKRFHITPLGIVHEFIVDPYHTICTIIYAIRIDPKKISLETKPEDIHSLLQKSPNDTITYDFYDTDSKHIYTVSSIGFVTEYIYDQNDRLQGHKIYADRVNPQKIIIGEPLSISEQLISQPLKDRISLTVFNAANKPRYFINAKGMVTEHILDRSYNPIQIIKYAKALKLDEPIQWNEKTLETLCDLTDVNNHVAYQIFDQFNRLRYVINENLYVIGYQYDAVHNQIEICAYANQLSKLPVSLDVKTITALVNKDNELNHINKKQYDSLKRKIIHQDANDPEQRWEFNALNTIRRYVDQKGHDWLTYYDDAGRKTDDLTPETDIHVMGNDTKEMDKITIEKIVRDRITKTSILNPNGTVAYLYHGQSSDDSKRRIVHNQYDDDGRCTCTTVPSIEVDDPTKHPIHPSDKVTQLTIVTHQFVYNHAANILVSINEAGYGHFKIYDTDQRLTYEVLPTGAVRYYQRNAFGEISLLTQFSNQIQLNLSAFLTTGLTLEDIEQPEVLIRSDDDRTIKIEYSQTGKKLTSSLSSTLLAWIEEDTLGWSETIGPCTQFIYDDFDRQIGSMKLICGSDTSEGKFEWAIHHQWIDATGAVLLEASSVNFNTFNIVQYTNNHEKRPVYEHHFIAQIQRTDLFTEDNNPQPLDKILKLINTKHNDKDIVYHYLYDAKGRCHTQTLLNETVYKTLFSTEYPQPAFKATTPLIKVPVDLVGNNQDINIKQILKFDPRHDKPIISLSPSNQPTHYYFDELARISDIIGPGSVLQNDSMPKAQSWVHAGYNAFNNKPVRHSKSYIGVTEDNLLIHGPMPAQETWRLEDNRGLTVAQQKPEHGAKFTTYTPSRHPARHYWFRDIYINQSESAEQLRSQRQTSDLKATLSKLLGVTVADSEGSSRYQFIKKAMEQCFDYDANGNLIFKLEINYDGTKEAVYLKYNMFDESVSIGPTQDFQPQKRWLNKMGLAFLEVGKDGIERIKLYDGLGKQVAQIQKPNDKTLSQTLTPKDKTEADIKERHLTSLLKAALKNKDFGNYQFSLFLRNHFSQVIKKYFPSFTAQKPKTPRPFYTSFEFRDNFPSIGRFSLVWKRPQNAFVTGTIHLKPTQQAESKPFMLPVKHFTDTLHDYADITELPIGYYDYDLRYKYNMENGGQDLGDNTPLTLQCIGQNDDALPLLTPQPTQTDQVVARLTQYNKLLLGGAVSNTVKVCIIPNTHPDATPIAVIFKPLQGIFLADLADQIMGDYKVQVNGKILPGILTVITSHMPQPGDIRTMEINIPALHLQIGLQFAEQKKHHKENRDIYVHCLSVDYDNMHPLLQSTYSPLLKTTCSSVDTSGSEGGAIIHLPLTKPQSIMHHGEEVSYSDEENTRFYNGTSIDKVNLEITLDGDPLCLLSEQVADKSQKSELLNGKLPEYPSLTTNLVGDPLCDWHWYIDNYYHSDNLLIAGIPEGVAHFTLEYLDYTLQIGHHLLHNRDRWRDISTIADFSSHKRFIIVASGGIPVGYYQYRLTLFDESLNILSITSDTFCITHDTGAIPAPKQKEQFTLLTPTEKQTYDGLNNVTSHTDRLDNTKIYDYNKRKQLIKTTHPQILAVDDDAKIQGCTPIEEEGYDADGLHIGSKDANSYVTAIQNNEAGAVLEIKDADGVFTKNILNGFSDVIRIENANGIVALREYDLMSRITKETDKFLAAETFAHDDAGNVSHHISKQGSETMTNHNIRNHVIETGNPRGQKTTFTVDRHGKLLALQDGLCAKGVDIPIQHFLDFFGNPDQSKPYQCTDRSGARYIIKLNNNMVEVSRRSEGGDHGDDNDPTTGEIRKTPPQNIRYLLDEFDNVIYVIDAARGSTDQQHYNAASECVGERFEDTNGMIFQDTMIITNAMGWIMMLLDDAVMCQYGYDLKGNRRHTSVYIKPNDKFIEWHIDSWFNYTKGDRVFYDDAKHTVNGKLEIGIDEKGKPKGHIMMYDMGGRVISETRQDKKDAKNKKSDDTHTLSVNITYDEQNENGDVTWKISQVDHKNPQATIQLGVYTLNKSGLLKSKTTWDYVKNKRQQVDYCLAEDGETVSSIRAQEFDLSKGNLLLDNSKKNPAQSLQTFSEAAVDGLSSKTKTYYPNDDKWLTFDEMATSFVFYLQRKISEVTGDELVRASSKGKPPKNPVPLTPVYEYSGPNGEFEAHTNSSDNDGTRVATTNAEDRIVAVRDGKAFKDAENFQFYFYNPRTKTSIGTYGNIPPLGQASAGQAVIDSTFKYQNFNLGYKLIKNLTPPPVPGYFVPHTPQSFNSISEAVYGSDRYGIELAKKNGGGIGSDIVPANTTIQVPPIQSLAYNNIHDNNVDSEAAKIGSLNPNIPRLIPKVHHHYLAEILDSIILAASTVLDFMTLGSSSTLSVIMLEQILISLSSNFATQMINMASGIEHHFDVNSFVLSGMQAAITPPQIKGAGFVHFAEQFSIDEAVEGVRQIVAVSTGVEHHLSWAGFAATALGSTSSALSNTLGYSDTSAGTALDTLSASGQAAIRGFNNHGQYCFQPTAIAAAMVGTAIGQSLLTHQQKAKATNQIAIHRKQLIQQMGLVYSVSDTVLTTQLTKANTTQDLSPGEITYHASEDDSHFNGHLDTVKATITPKQQQANTQSTLAYSRAIQHQQQNQRALSHFLWSHQSDILSGAVNDARVLFFMMNAGAAVGGIVGTTDSHFAANDSDIFHDIGIVGKSFWGEAARLIKNRYHEMASEDPREFVRKQTQLPNKTPSPIQTLQSEWNVLKETANNLGTAVKTYHALKGDAANKYLGTSLASGLKFSVQHLLWVVGSTEGERLNSFIGVEEILTPETLANKIGKSTGNIVQPLRDKGFKVEIPHGNRNIVVRMMNEGGGRKNYYRISVEGKQTFTKSGEASTDRALTHINIEPSSHEDILNIINKIRNENDPRFNP